MNNCSLLGMQNIYKKKHKSHSYDSYEIIMQKYFL